jgi:hypothetical protein
MYKGGCMAFPESGLVRKTFTFRRMDLPPSIELTKRSLLRWFALSFGLISEQESRDTVLNVLDAIFYFLLSKRQNPSTLDIQAYISEKHHKKVGEKLLRYHLNKLIAVELIGRKSNRYFLNNNPYAEPNSLEASFQHWIKQPVNSTMDDIEKVLSKLSESYKK